MVNGVQMTLEQWMPEIFQKQIVGVSELPVRTSLLPEKEKALREIDHPSLENYLESLEKSGKKISLNGSSMKMLRECLAATEDLISCPYSLSWMWGGYDIEWQLLNSKLHGVPQNRERVYTIGHLRARGCRKIFPLSKTHGTNINNIIDVKQIGKASRTNRDNLNQYRVYDVCGVGPALNCMNGGGRQPHILMECKQGQYRPFLSKKSTGFLYELHDGCNVQAIWNDHINNCICIRKLTPRECFRLQGWTDDYFEKAQFVNSDSQLYKQAGNGVTVNVVYEIAKKMTKEKTNDQ